MISKLLPSTVLGITSNICCPEPFTSKSPQDSLASKCDCSTPFCVLCVCWDVIHIWIQSHLPFHLLKCKIRVILHPPSSCYWTQQTRGYRSIPECLTAKANYLTTHYTVLRYLCHCKQTGHAATSDHAHQQYYLRALHIFSHKQNIAFIEWPFYKSQL